MDEDTIPMGEPPTTNNDATLSGSDDGGRYDEEQMEVHIREKGVETGDSQEPTKAWIRKESKIQTMGSEQPSMRPEGASLAGSIHWENMQQVT
jgi:hypothetical protein